MGDHAVAHADERLSARGGSARIWSGGYERHATLLIGWANYMGGPRAVTLFGFFGIAWRSGDGTGVDDGFEQFSASAGS